MVLSAFFYGYVCSQIFGAYLSSRVGPKPVLGAAVLLWSVVTCLTPHMAAVSARTLAWARIALGLFEGVTYPVMFHLFADHVPVAERSWAVGVINMGNGLGAMTAFALSPVLIAAAGWQMVFYVFGAVGIGWAVLWMAVVDAKPSVSPAGVALPDGKSPPAKANLAEGAVPINVPRLLSKMLRTPPVLVIMLGHFSNNFGGYMMLAWLPTLLSDEYGVDGSALWITCLPYASYLVGAGLGGIVTGACTMSRPTLPNVSDGSAGHCCHCTCRCSPVFKWTLDSCCIPRTSQTSRHSLFSPSDCGLHHPVQVASLRAATTCFKPARFCTAPASPSGHCACWLLPPARAPLWPLRSSAWSEWQSCSPRLEGTRQTNWMWQARQP